MGSTHMRDFLTQVPLEPGPHSIFKHASEESILCTCDHVNSVGNPPQGAVTSGVLRSSEEDATRDVIKARRV